MKRLLAWFRRPAKRCDADGCDARATTEATFRMMGKSLIRHYCNRHAADMVDALMVAEVTTR